MLYKCQNINLQTIDCSTHFGLKITVEVEIYFRSTWIPSDINCNLVTFLVRRAKAMLGITPSTPLNRNPRIPLETKWEWDIFESLTANYEAGVNGLWRG